MVETGQTKQFHPLHPAGFVRHGKLSGSALEARRAQNYPTASLVVELTEFLWSLVTIYISARLMGELAARVGQPVVLGELLAGVLIGGSILGLVEESQTLTLFAQIGVILLLFEIGLECDLQSFLQVGRSAALVAVIGMLAPFALGYGLARALDIAPFPALFIGAALTPTSVAIPARILSELGRLKSREGNILLGAAVVDDILALVTLSVLVGLAESGQVSLGKVAQTSGTAVVFLGAAVIIGIRYAHLFSHLVNNMTARGRLIVAAMTFALLLSSAAEFLHMAPLVGAFAAGLVLARTEHQIHILERIKPVADVFVPVFFVLVGIAVDLHLLNPFDTRNWSVLFLGCGLTIAAIFGKLIAGLGVLGRAQAWVIGVGMVPRGEVVLIFASLGLSLGIFSKGVYGAMLFMVLVSTFIPPIVLKALYRRQGGSAQTNGVG